MPLSRNGSATSRLLVASPVPFNDPYTANVDCPNASSVISRDVSEILPKSGAFGFGDLIGTSCIKAP